MRKFIDIVKLCEGATFRPAVKRVEDGQTYIEFPNAAKIEVTCPCCDGDGKDVQYEWTKADCECCGGTGKDEKLDFPSMHVGYSQSRVISELLGVGDEESGWVEPAQIPELRRHLIRLKNGDLGGYTREPRMHQRTGIDRSGDIPRIGAVGPKMIGGGLGVDHLTHYIDRLLEILDWAQKNGCGFSWA